MLFEFIKKENDLYMEYFIPWFDIFNINETN
jgi:hypothetical protein